MGDSAFQQKEVRSILQGVCQRIQTGVRERDWQVAGSRNHPACSLPDAVVVRRVKRPQVTSTRERSLRTAIAAKVCCRFAVARGGEFFPGDSISRLVKKAVIKQRTFRVIRIVNP
jgi:hypothetical protein